MLFYCCIDTKCLFEWPKNGGSWKANVTFLIHFLEEILLEYCFQFVKSDNWIWYVVCLPWILCSPGWKLSNFMRTTSSNQIGRLQSSKQLEKKWESFMLRWDQKRSTSEKLHHKEAEKFIKFTFKNLRKIKTSASEKCPLHQKNYSH